MSEAHEITLPKYACPKHGLVDDVISSTMTGYEGKWCMLCWCESLDRNDVCRVTEPE